MMVLMNTISRFALALLPLALAACTTTPRAASPPDQFLAHLRTLCGKSYAGRVLVDVPASTDPNPFTGKPLVMHVRDCEADVVRIPFNVGDDRSRTWVVTRTPTGLRLKHDHRHADGSEDALTQYGGDTTGAGTATRQQFPVDAESRALFTRTQREVSNRNTWAIEVEPGRVFVYELARPGGRLFRVAFDLEAPVPTPPPAWGAGTTDR